MRLLIALLGLTISAPTFAQEPGTDTPVEAVEAPAEVPVVAAPAGEEAEALVEEPPELEGDIETAEEAVSTVVAIINAAQSGNWGLMLAGILMLSVWVLRTFLWSSMKKEWIPYITAGTGTAVAFASAVIGGSSLVEALAVAAGGLFAGLSAIGAWEILGKKILKKPTRE